MEVGKQGRQREMETGRDQSGGVEIEAGGGQVDEARWRHISQVGGVEMEAG